MTYLEFAFIRESGEEYQQDLLIHALGEAGFDTFEETITGFNAYIPSSSFDQELFQAVLEVYQPLFAFRWERRDVPQKNWNEVWESNFEPLLVKNTCYVRATFHAARPDYPIEIIIDPKMAFGTGHHQTTTMMLEFLLEEAVSGKKVLDMGAGTGILAILAFKLNAGAITAIDYDPICYDSILENARINQCVFEEVLCGSKEVIPVKSFDLILANINRNILLEQMPRYAEVLKPGGELYLSGFFDADLEIITQCANTLGLSFVKRKF